MPLHTCNHLTARQIALVYIPFTHVFYVHSNANRARITGGSPTVKVSNFHVDHGNLNKHEVELYQRRTGLRIRSEQRLKYLVKSGSEIFQPGIRIHILANPT